MSDEEAYAANWADSELAGHDYEDPFVPDHAGDPTWDDVRQYVERAYVAGFEQAMRNARERLA